MGHVKDLLVTIHNGGDNAVQAAVALAGLEKHMQAQVAIDNATGDITDIVTVLRGVGFAALSPSADSSTSLLHYCVNHAADEIERLRDERRWVAVSERLPPLLTEVLGWHPDDRVRAWFRHSGTVQGGPRKGVYWESWTPQDRECDDCNVKAPTHWLPLPEPPEVK
jgi:2-polyprenyl-6-methoxyphenol hydroxylase-like FAD-dependent oxidoreductase